MKRKNELENKRFDLDHDDELFELEQEVFFRLQEYDVEFPSEEEMMRTIDAIRPHVPKKKHFFEPVFNLLKHSTQEIFRISPLFWGTNGAFMVVSLLFFFMAEEFNPYFTIMLLAPIPTIVGVLEMIKSKSGGMMELELSLKYSWQELLLARMLVVGGFNVGVNLVFMLGISLIMPQVWLGKLLIFWLTPFTILTAVSLVIVTRFRKLHVVTATLVCWIGLSIVIQQTELYHILAEVPPLVYVAVIAAASIFIIFNMMRIYKRGISYEFNH